MSAKAKYSPHTMNHELLKAVATGNKALLNRVLHLESAPAAEGGKESCLKGVTAEGSSALHIAANRGYLELVKVLCDQDTSLISSRNNLLDTPLICAARAGHVDVVNYLIKCASQLHEALYPQRVLQELPVNPILKAWNLGGATAMHEAVRNGHASVLQRLVSRDSRLLAVVNGQGVSPLYLAVASNRVDIVNILIKGSSNRVKSPSSYAGPHRQTALHAAVFATNGQEIAESLINWEPTLGEKADSYGRTALHYAASTGKDGIVKLLLGNSSLAYVRDKDGLFPVHAAAIAGNVSVVREFMEICPNSDELLDSRQRNILHLAVDHGKIMLVRHFCKNANFVTMMNARDDEGNTPLHVAVKHGHVAIFSILIMDLRVNLGIINYEGLTPLDIAFNQSWYEYSFSSVYIIWCLYLCDAYCSPYYRASDPRDHTDKQCLEDTEKSILCISVLIAAASFPAAFTPPGGYIPEGKDAGMPVLGSKTSFSVYVSANSFSFYASAIVTCLLVHSSLKTTTPKSMSRRRYYLFVSAGIMVLAITSMLIAFSRAVRLTLNPSNSGNGFILFCFIYFFEISLFHMLALPISTVAVPICLRVAMKLGKSKHPMLDIIKVLAAMIFPVFEVCRLIGDAQLVTKKVHAAFLATSVLESSSWPGCLIQGDPNLAYPT